MRIAISTNNKLKVNALKEAVAELEWLKDAEIIQVEEKSGVSSLPQNIEEAIQGALNRAKYALKEGKADIGIGVEGAVYENPFGMFLCAYVAIVMENKLRIASSMHLLMPEKLKELVRKEKSLNKAAEKLTGIQNVKYKQGTFGILTANIVTRKHALKEALKTAFASLKCKLYES